MKIQFVATWKRHRRRWLICRLILSFCRQDTLVADDDFDFSYYNNMIYRSHTTTFNITTSTILLNMTLVIIFFLARYYTIYDQYCEVLYSKMRNCIQCNIWKWIKCHDSVGCFFITNILSCSCFKITVCCPDRWF